MAASSGAIRLLGGGAPVLVSDVACEQGFSVCEAVVEAIYAVWSVL